MEDGGSSVRLLATVSERLLRSAYRAGMCSLRVYLGSMGQGGWVEHAGLNNESVVVLGGAGLIGSAICAELLAHGARVVAVDNRQEALEQLAGDGIETYLCDITDPVERAALVDRIADTAPRYFVHAAGGVGHTQARFPDPFEWFARHDVHLHSPVLLAHAVLNVRHERGQAGSAVFLSSVHARFLKNDAVYSSAKAGLEIAARELALVAVQHGSRVNVVAPGHVSLFPVKSPPTKLGRKPLAPEPIAKAVRFLLCDDCSPATTGSVLQVDGGLGLWAPWGPH